MMTMIAGKSADIGMVFPQISLIFVTIGMIVGPCVGYVL
jgi:hypothetical protein